MAFMSGLEPLSPLLQVCASVLLCTMAVATAAVWYGRRKHFYLLWLAAGLLLFAWASYRYTPQQRWLAQASVTYVCWAGICCVVQSIAMRFGRIAHFPVIVGASLGLLLCSVYFTYQAPHAVLYPFITAGVLAGIFGHVLPLVWSSAKRHPAERALQWVYGLITLGLLLSPWLGGQSLFMLPPFLGWLLLAAGGLVSAMLGSALQDGAAGVRTDRYSDVLTGVLNRSGFELNCGPRPIEKAITVMALCELDHFPRMQQQLGSQISHEVLQHFAQLLQDSVREGDWVARIGEQEFALALCNLEVADARALVLRIKNSLCQQAWAHKGQQGPITVSFSVVQLREHDSLNLALHRADVLLCQAKEEGEGENCLVVDSDVHHEIAVFSIASNA